MAKRSFFREQTGATMIEYGLVAALVAIGMMGASQGLGHSLCNTFWEIAGAIH